MDVPYFCTHPQPSMVACASQSVGEAIVSGGRGHFVSLLKFDVARGWFQPYHSVDLSDGPAKFSCLKACVEERLQQSLMVNTLVEVITPDSWRVLRKGLRISVDRLWYVELVCHIAFKDTYGVNGTSQQFSAALSRS